MQFDFHLHLHFASDPSTGEVLSLLRSIKEQGVVLHEQYLDLMKKMDEATTKIAARINKQTELIKNSMTDEEVAEVKAAMQAEVDRLDGLGKDPTNPVPPE